MSFILSDLGNPDPARDLHISGWHWRPLVEIIERLNLLPEEKIIHLTTQGSTVQVSEEEARALAGQLREILKVLPENGRLLSGGTVVTETFEELHERGEPYSVSHRTIEKFIVFCETCQGFKIC
jgi:hypothetical protein